MLAGRLPLTSTPVIADPACMWQGGGTTNRVEFKITLNPCPWADPTRKAPRGTLGGAPGAPAAAGVLVQVKAFPPCALSNTTGSAQEGFENETVKSG